MENIKFNQDKKEEVKKVTGVRKLIIPALITLASVLPMKEVSAQKSQEKKLDNIENIDLQLKMGVINHDIGNGTILPSNTWNFLEEYKDSAWAKNESKIYPGFIENYLKTENQKYIFNGYEDKDGNIINTPDFIKAQIKKENEVLEKYKNSEEWAKKQFEYQKTKEFKTEVINKRIEEVETWVKDIKSRIELLNLNKEEYSKEDQDIDNKKLDNYTKSLDHDKRDPQWWVEHETHTEQELMVLAKDYINLTNKHIKEYKEELNSVLTYIEQNKQK